MICKDPEKWTEYTINEVINVCPECKKRFANEILLVCNICDSMCFITKTPKNIERLKYFVDATITHFWISDVIVPMNGCPHCVSFQGNPLGEVKEEYKSKDKNTWK
jgi:hypothetical protein